MRLEQRQFQRMLKIVLLRPMQKLMRGKAVDDAAIGVELKVDP